PGGLHHPVWIEDPDFDLDFHVRKVTVAPPGGRREMDETIAEIASWPLDRSRPLWEIWMLEGLEGDRVGFLAKIHHTLADGVAVGCRPAAADPAVEARREAASVAARLAGHRRRVPEHRSLARPAPPDAAACARGVEAPQDGGGADAPSDPRYAPHAVQCRAHA